MFPNIFGQDHDAFSAWLAESAPLILDCPSDLGKRFRRCDAGTSLARVFSYLARQEDVARRCQDFLLLENPEPAFRELMRAAGDGLEFDLDNVVVLQHIHRKSRQLLVPLYLELPLVRERPEASRVTKKNIAALPESVRRAPWALQGAELHAACFDQFEARLDDELRRSSRQPTSRHRQVVDLLNATLEEKQSVATVHGTYQSAVRRLSSGEPPAPCFKSRLAERERCPGVNVFGFFASDIGIGESSRVLHRRSRCLRS